MTTLAHLTDLHLLEDEHDERTGLERARLAYLTLGRPTNAARRRLRVQRALEAARSADHVVVTGDLTEDGLDRQFEILAELLHQSRVAPTRVTLLPGNHDAYADPTAFSRALSGPLAPYARTSGGGAVVRLRGATLVAISTAVRQSFTRSAGAIGAGQLELVRSLARETRFRGEPLVVALHHAPEPHTFSAVTWLDGLLDGVELMRILEENDHVSVLHGHTHAASDRPVRRGATRRIFSAASVVGSDRPVRHYLARHGRVWPEVGRSREAQGEAALSF